MSRAAEPLAVVSFDRRKGINFGENEDEQEQWEFDGATIKRVLNEDGEADWQALVQEAIKGTTLPPPRRHPIRLVRAVRVHARLLGRVRCLVRGPRAGAARRVEDDTPSSGRRSDTRILAAHARQAAPHYRGDGSAGSKTSEEEGRRCQFSVNGKCG